MYVHFPWQEKLVAPLIANLIGNSQCEDRVTNRKGKRQLQATEVIRVHKEKDSFCNKLDKVLIQITLCRMS